MFRVVQQGAAPVVIAYLVGKEQDAKLRAALPGLAVVATHEAPPTPPRTELDVARRMVSLDGAPYILVGYSAGCQAVRTFLRSGAEPVAVATIDGTHASLPALAWQLDVWRQLADEARRGDVLWVATCTRQTYTEDLVRSRDGHDPFMSTLRVLETVLDLPLPAGIELHDGDLHVISYDSARIDGEAHKRQLSEVLPVLLAQYVAPYVLDDPPTHPAAVVPLPEPETWGEAVLEAAKAWLNLVPKEDKGHNRGDAIDAWLRAVGVALGSPYCAAFASQCIRDASKRLGLPAPVAGSAGAKRLGDQFSPRLRTARGPGLAAKLRPGDLLIWDRSKKGPGETGYEGHVQIVIERVGENSAGVIEGNADRLVTGGHIQAVVQSEVRLDDLDLLYACTWPAIAAPADVA